MDHVFDKLGREVELVPIDQVKVYENNTRNHTLKQISKIAGGIAGVGYLNPIIVDENYLVLAGAGRLAAAKKLGCKLIAVIRVYGLTQGQKRAYMVADNRLHDESTFDKRKLKSELEALAVDKVDLSLTGFDSLEIDKFMSLADLEAANDAPVRLPHGKIKPISRLGDLYHIGDHRILCADARDPVAYERLVGGQSIQLICTDPPYGCPIANNVSGLGEKKHENFVMGAGETSLSQFARDILRPALRCMATHAAPGALAFVFTDWRASPYLHDAALGVFHEQKNLIVWVKDNAGMGTCYRSGHELCHLYKVSPGKHINNFGLGEGGRHRSNVWQYPGANTFRKGRLEDLADHSTVKNLKMIADAIVDCSLHGGLVFDAFLGSGTTISAAHMVGRRGYGMELDPKYVDVIVRRVSEATGMAALLDGVTPFAEVAAQRRAEAGAADNG